MNIILISNSRKRSFRISLKPFSLALITASLVIFSCALVYSGYLHAVRESAEILGDIRQRTVSAWETEINDQRLTLAELRATTEKSLDTMAGRLSTLQGYVMRLDAVGSRLAAMADLNDIEFGIENTPGMGGPSPDPDQSPAFVPDIFNTFDELESTLIDRSEKLAAMESMLINRTLQEQRSLGGKPSLGGYLSSMFGYRTDPMTGKKAFHEGIDFAGKSGTPIVAVAAGIVTWSGTRFGYGKLIEISHGNGYVTRYAHNSKNLVNVGEKIEKGEVIALMGNSGRSTGTHVHFEIIQNGRHVDPKKYLSAK